MSESRCVNCGVNVFRMRRHSIDNEEARSLIQQWNSLSEIQSGSVVCHACWVLIEQARNKRDGVPTQTVGHQNLCVGCGHSLHHIRSHLLSNSSERESAIKHIIEDLIAPRQLRASDKICHPCWQRSFRTIQRNSSEPVPSTSSMSGTTSILNVQHVSTSSK